LAEVAENCYNPAMGVCGWGGGGASLKLILITWRQAVRQMRGVGRGEVGGEGRGDMRQITAHSNPYSCFSLSFFVLCIRRGFDEKISYVAVQNTLRPPRNESGFFFFFQPEVPFLGMDENVPLVLTGLRGHKLFEQKKVLPSLLKILCSAYTQYMQNNRTSLNTGPIKKLFLLNLNI
jgi:hypothetical protein